MEVMLLLACIVGILLSAIAFRQTLVGIQDAKETVRGKLRRIAKWQLGLSALFCVITYYINDKQDRDNTKALNDAKKNYDNQMAAIQDLRSEQVLTGKFDFDIGEPVDSLSTISIIWGTDRHFLPADGRARLMGFKNGFEPIRFAILNRKLVISLKAYDIDGSDLVTIDNNNWTRSPNSSYKFNYDKRGFEIFDDSDNVALNVNFISNNIVRIQGYFLDKKNHSLIAAGQTVRPNPLPTSYSIEKVNNFLKVDPPDQLFEYSGEHPLHKRSTFRTIKLDSYGTNRFSF